MPPLVTSLSLRRPFATWEDYFLVFAALKPSRCIATTDTDAVVAYDLLSGPLKGKSNDTASVETILKQAKHLADNMKVAFDTLSGVPDNTLIFEPPRTAGSTTNGIATIGTLVMEWTRLSDLTGDASYGKLAQKGEEYLLNPKPASAEPYPGLIGTNVNITDGHFVDARGGWVGGADSFYEYLIKMYLYDPDRFGEYKERWIAAVESSITYLASHPTTRPDLTFLAIYNNQTLRFVSQHCKFVPPHTITQCPTRPATTLSPSRDVSFHLTLPRVLSTH